MGRTAHWSFMIGYLIRPSSPCAGVPLFLKNGFPTAADKGPERERRAPTRVPRPSTRSVHVLPDTDTSLKGLSWQSRPTSPRNRRFVPSCRHEPSPSPWTTPPRSSPPSLFNEHHFHHLLVVQGRELLGIISDRDLLKAVSPHIGTLSETDRPATLNKRVHQIMSRKLITPQPTRLWKPQPDCCLSIACPASPSSQRQGFSKGIITWRDLLREYFGTKARRRLIARRLQPWLTTLPPHAKQDILVRRLSRTLT